MAQSLIFDKVEHTNQKSEHKMPENLITTTTIKSKTT